MEGSGDHFVLLFFGKLDKVYGITGYADGKLRIFFRMFLRIQKSVPVEYIHIQVMTAFCGIAV